MKRIATALRAFLAALSPAPPPPPPRPLPWRPFHPEPLTSGPEPHLEGAENSLEVRAIMELLEEEITREVQDVTRLTNDHLPRNAGMLEALLTFHARIESTVRPPTT